MNIRRTLLITLLSLGVAFVATSCKGKGPAANWTDEVEVAPGEWLAIEGAAGRAWFRCQWQGKMIYWPGKVIETKWGAYDSQLPKSLRSLDGTLYLIYDDHPKSGSNHYVFCKLNDAETGFEVMKKEDFPRKIATQNIGADHEGFAKYPNGDTVDFLQLTRDLAVEDVFFWNMTTGHIWRELEGGVRNPGGETAEAVAFGKAFVEKYHPIALPEIEREKK